MRLYISNTSNPYFNIATEEYFLKYFDEDFFNLYINEPSLIVGKHQNTIAEINVPYVINNQIKVVRRLSGGGTVYHDHGNLNYCFIKKGNEGYLVDFKRYSQPILNTLKQLSINAYLRGKSDLVIDDLKFSGNAEHVYRSKVLHHGTLLFDSDLSKLNQAIKNDWSRFNDRAVRSNRSKVTNISNHLQEPLSIEHFKQLIINEVQRTEPTIRTYELTQADLENINNLVIEKYSQWDWNFGYSPKYKLEQNIKHKEQNISSSLFVNKGIIEDAAIYIDEVLNKEISSLLTGKAHHYYELLDLLKKNERNIAPEILINVLF